MKAWAIKHLLHFCHWALARWGEDGIVLRVAKDDLFTAALAGVAEAEGLHSPDHDEAKRHHAYALLRDTFPQRSKQDISLAIEAALFTGEGES